MVEINREACTGCGECVRECLPGNLSLEEGRAAVRGECFRCGHCAAICPQGAVSLPEYDMEDVEAFDPAGFSLDTDVFLRAVKFRRSIRRYQPRPVEREKLERIVQAGRYTATAKNSQGCRFLVVQEGLAEFKRIIWEGIGRAVQAGELEAFRGFYEDHRRASERDFLFRDAPAVLFVATEAPVDAGLAAQNMELAAVSQGLGVLYNGYLCRAAAEIPEALAWLGAGEKPPAACMLAGYPAAAFVRTAPRRAADVVWR